MEVFRYWIGASPLAPMEQAEDVETLRDAFHKLDRDAEIEQYGILGGMILLKVETQSPLTLDFSIPQTVVAFEHRRL